MGSDKLFKKRKLRARFEIWYLLHYNYIDAGFSRTQYQAKLTELMKVAYQKNAPDMYKRLQKRQYIALQNAQKLYNRKIQTGTPPAQQNPVTTVFKLVERLNG
jgi:hypothetical protein